MGLASGGQFAFVLETKSEYSRSWCRVTDAAGGGGIALGGGVEDVAEGTVQNFADTVLDRYAAYLATVPEYAELYLREEDLDVRVHVWDLGEVPYGAVIDPDSYPAHLYWAALKHAGIGPGITVTWSAVEVWRHLNAAVEANEAAAKQPAANAQPAPPDEPG